jgi:hypothetical protein
MKLKDFSRFGISWDLSSYLGNLEKSFIYIIFTSIFFLEKVGLEKSYFTVHFFLKLYKIKKN